MGLGRDQVPGLIGAAAANCNQFGNYHLARGGNVRGGRPARSRSLIPPSIFGLGVEVTVRLVGKIFLTCAPVPGEVSLIICIANVVPFLQTDRRETEVP